MISAEELAARAGLRIQGQKHKSLVLFLKLEHPVSMVGGVQGRRTDSKLAAPAATRQMWSPEPGRTPPAATLPPSPGNRWVFSDLESHTRIIDRLVETQEGTKVVPLVVLGLSYLLPPHLPFESLRIQQ